MKNKFNTDLRIIIKELTISILIGFKRQDLLCEMNFNIDKNSIINIDIERKDCKNSQNKINIDFNIEQFTFKMQVNLDYISLEDFNERLEIFKKILKLNIKNFNELILQQEK
ncbi:hypothetical protein HG273_001797 [Campylobacter coli]|nr:hypothetical protein [Campylobacter coli]